METDFNSNKYTNKILLDRDKFSLNEQFSLDYDNINAVTLITPTQTISCFTDIEKNKFGSGNHAKKMSEILYAIYEEKFENNNNHQDIRIEYTNFDYDPVPFCQILIRLPKVINLSQYKSLCHFNIEIMKLQAIKNNLIKIYIGNEEKTLGRKLLNINDILLDLVDHKILGTIVDNNHEFKYPEKHIIGYPNKENHYNDSEFTVGDMNRKVK